MRIDKNKYFFHWSLIYTTSSAIFVIALYPSCLSSLATGPKILFPIGLISHFASLDIRMTALSPNLT
jgi:hypothetical protein